MTMKVVLDEFEDRGDEVNRYFALLREIDASSTLEKESREWNAIDDDTFSILKANAFLVLYNLVESSIRTGLNAAYAAIAGEGGIYQEMSEKLQELWIKTELRKIDPRSSTHDAYLKQARFLV